MKTGSVKTTNFDNLKSKKLKLVLPKNSSQYDTISNCATAAISLITGLSPRYIQRYCKYPAKNGWYIDDMVEFIRGKGYKVVEVTKNSVTNVFWKSHPLTSDHCLLVISRMNTEEFSALVIHKGKTWHNLLIEPSSNLFFLNKPTLNVYIIQHLKWK